MFLALISQYHVSLNKLLFDHEKNRSCKHTLNYLCAHPLVKTSQSFITDHFDYRIKSSCMCTSKEDKNQYYSSEMTNKTVNLLEFNSEIT